MGFQGMIWIIFFYNKEKQLCEDLFCRIFNWGSTRLRKLPHKILPAKDKWVFYDLYVNPNIGRTFRKDGASIFIPNILLKIERNFHSKWNV